MRKKCGVCESPNASAIDELLVNRCARRQISSQFGIPKHSIDYHAVNHLHKRRVAVELGEDASNIDKLHAEATRIMHGAADEKARLAAINTLLRLEELKIRASLEQREDPSTWAAHPANASILDGIMGRLEGHPSALEDVLDYMRETIGEPMTIPRGVPAASDAVGGGQTLPSEVPPFSE